MSENRVRCLVCKRQVATERIGGLLVPHRTKPGRKGKHCPGAGKLPATRPERSVA